MKAQHVYIHNVIKWNNMAESSIQPTKQHTKKSYKGEDWERLHKIWKRRAREIGGLLKIGKLGACNNYVLFVAI